jgi:hypothetical protein
MIDETRYKCKSCNALHDLDEVYKYNEVKVIEGPEYEESEPFTKFEWNVLPKIVGSSLLISIVLIFVLIILTGNIFISLVPALLVFFAIILLETHYIKRN